MLTARSDSSSKQRLHHHALSSLLCTKEAVRKRARWEWGGGLQASLGLEAPVSPAVFSVASAPEQFLIHGGRGKTTIQQTPNPHGRSGRGDPGEDYLLEESDRRPTAAVRILAQKPP